jgi:hypothetical protein
MSTHTNTLASIQFKLKAGKDSYNSFGKYKYRSCESILAALKPALNEVGYSISLSDEIVAVLDRVYVKATCTLFNENGIPVGTTSAFARESLVKKGMDDAQCTGSASSYARKYALCGMFAIDDSSVDPDATNKHEEGSALNEKEISLLRGAENKDELKTMCESLVNRGKNRDEVLKIYREVSATLAR